MVTLTAKFQEGVGRVAGFWIWNCPSCRSTIAHEGAVPATVPSHCYDFLEVRLVPDAAERRNS